MFKRAIIGKEIVYKQGDKPVAAVLSGDVVNTITKTSNYNPTLRYLAINETDHGSVKAKHIADMVAHSKARDGINSLVTFTGYVFTQNGSKSVSLNKI